MSLAPPSLARVRGAAVKPGLVGVTSGAGARGLIRAARAMAAPKKERSR